MKKFITVIPLQPEGQLKKLHYDAVGNQALQMEEDTCFPIMTAINGYVKSGETFEVVAITMDLADVERNFGIFQQELKEICERNGIVCSKIQRVDIPNDETVVTHAETFEKIIEHLQENDDLYLCITYGTKPLTMAVKMAVQYAYRVKSNTSISCMLYGDFRGKKVYDQTALVQLDEIIRLLAERGVKNPDGVIHTLLKL